MSEKRIMGWLKGCVYSRHASAIDLARLKSGRSKSEHLQTFFVETEGDEGFSERELAEEIFRVASEEAIVLGGRRHRYQLQADTESETNISRMSFAIVNLKEDEAADFEGGRDQLVPQLMRHNELLMRTTVGSFQAQMRTMIQTVEMLSERLMASEERASEAMVLVHETHDAKLLLAAETRKAEADATNIEEVKSQFIKWAPIIATHFLRKNGADITTGIPESFLDMVQSLRPKQIQQLTEVLDADQSALIGELWFSLRDAEDAEKAKGTSNGEAKKQA